MAMNPNRMQSLPRPLRLFVLTLAGLTLACLAAEFVCAHFLHLGYPYDWPLYDPRHSFNDLIIYHPRFAAFGTPAFFDPPWYPFTYPAPAALVYRALYAFADYVTAFLVLGGTAVAAAIALFGQALRRAGGNRVLWLLLLPTVLCAYPIAFEFQQANLELVSILFTSLGLWAFCRQRAWPAALCFALAGAIKLFPLVFLALLLGRRQLRQALAALGLAGALIALSLWIACPQWSAALAGVNAGADFFRTEYALRTTTAFDHSLFSLAKAAVVLAHPGTLSLAPLVLNVYLALATLGAVSLYVLRVRKLPALNQMLALAIFTVLLPPVSFDYTLLVLYAPWALLVLSTLAHGSRADSPGQAFVALAVVFAPESECIVRGVALGSQVKTLALVWLLVLALRRSVTPAQTVAEQQTPAL